MAKFDIEGISEQGKRFVSEGQAEPLTNPTR
jgi:hypothetical protein